METVVIEYCSGAVSCVQCIVYRVHWCVLAQLDWCVLAQLHWCVLAQLHCIPSVLLLASVAAQWTNRRAWCPSRVSCANRYFFPRCSEGCVVNIIYHYISSAFCANINFILKCKDGKRYIPYNQGCSVRTLWKLYKKAFVCLGWLGYT